MTQPAVEQIQRTIEAHPYVLYLRGTPLVANCGYSAAMVEILKRRNVTFEAIDVDADPTLLDALVEHSGWPSLPQLFAHGRLVGGIDLIRELDRTDELDAALAAP